MDTGQSTTKHAARGGLLPLVLLNAVLLLAVALVTWSPTVQAQLGQRSNYLMVTGSGDEEHTDLIWILDTHSGRLATVNWSESGQGMNAASGRNIQQDIENILRTR